MNKMAKDPAVLFYTQDFLTGTMLMTNEQRGKYIVLLCLQHQKGTLTERDMLKICGEYDPDIWAKFNQQDDDFYNKRMLQESVRRMNYTKSRRGNLGQQNTHKDPHMQRLMDLLKETETETEIETSEEESKSFLPPTEDEVITYFIEKGYKREIAKKAFLYYSEQNWHDSRGKPIKSWKGKMVAVWFKEENKHIEKGYVNLKELRDERKQNR